MQKKIIKKGGKRLDRYILDQFPSSTLSEVYKWIRVGRVKVNSKKQKHSYKLKNNDMLTLYLTDDQISDYSKEGVVHKKTFKTVYEDKNILVLDKPPFLVSQGGPGLNENNLVNQVRFYLNDPKLVISLGNRLDKETSGLMVLGKNRDANSKIYDLTKKREIEKKYYALVYGKLKNKRGTFKDYLAKGRKNFQQISRVVSKDHSWAKFSSTEYKVLKQYKDYALLELKLNTGRMHQIRVQLSSRNLPIVGDKLYGDETINKTFPKLKRQFLHACQVKFRHPFTNKMMDLKSELPSDLNKVIKSL